jgi:hypothetical protein
MLPRLIGVVDLGMAVREQPTHGLCPCLPFAGGLGTAIVAPMTGQGSALCFRSLMD